MPPPPPPPQQPPFQFQQMRQALPRVPQRGRGRGRGRRGRVNRSTGPGVGVRSTGVVVVRDTEYLGVIKKGLNTFEFNPGPEGLKRLSKQAAMYERYRIISVTVAYKPATSTYNTNVITIGILPGVLNSQVKTANDILAMKPAMQIPVWKGASLTLGRLIDSQRFMHCNTKDDGGMSFCLYTFGTEGADQTGSLVVTYHIEFAYPRPF